MSDKKTVLQSHPGAGAQFLNGIPGAKAPYDKDHWRIFTTPDGIADMNSPARSVGTTLNSLSKLSLISGGGYLRDA